MLKRICKVIARFHKSHRYPVAVIAALGFGGFLLDYLWKPISTAGLILLGLAVSPWLMKVVRVRKGTVGGWEFELGYQSDPGATGERLAEELREDEDTPSAPAEPEAETLQTDQEASNRPEEPSRPEPSVQTKSSRAFHQAQIARAYLAEGLVFQELQREFGGTVQREVRIGPYAVDGIVFGPSGPVAVEVKLVSTGKAIRTRLIDAALRLLQLSSLGGERFSNLRPLLAVVVENMDDASSNWRRRLREVQAEFPKIDFRTFALEELLSKYGLEERRPLSIEG